VAMSLGWPVRQAKDLGKPANLLQVEEALPRGFGVAEERGSRIVRPELPADREIEHLTNGTTDPFSLGTAEWIDSLHAVVHYGGRDRASFLLENGAGDGNGSPDDGIEATYSYVDETGNLLFQVCRMLPGAKSRFLQRRPDERGEWVWKLDDPKTKHVTRRVLFRLPQLIEAVERGMVVLIPEGKKDVLTVMQLGFAATCNPGGAAKRGSKWRPQYNEHLRGADVVLIPDSDEAGCAHVNAIGEALTGIARPVRRLHHVDRAQDARARLAHFRCCSFAFKRGAARRT
jgi:5S rRNA maturation endonuclease (ribonuclease M5)